MNNNFITINLLAKEKKKTIREYLLLTFSRYFATYLFVLFSFLGIVLLVSQIVLSNVFNSAIAQGTLVTREYGGINSLIRILNSKLITIVSIEDTFTPWSEITLKIFKVIPAGVSLTSISLERSSRDTFIRGIAASRGDLIGLTKALNASGMFEAVESPLSNLLIKENIPFEIKAKISSVVFKPGGKDENNKNAENSVSAQSK